MARASRLTGHQPDAPYRDAQVMQALSRYAAQRRNSPNAVVAATRHNNHYTRPSYRWASELRRSAETAQF